MKMKERDYLFDNYKAFLIVLVVVGHFIEVASDDNVVMETTKWIIFSFHMPAFVFISGYFSKKTQGIYKLLQQLVVPYLVFEILYYILYTYILNRDTELAFLYPKFSLWYLLAMFMWKMIKPLFRRLPGYLWIAFVLGLFVGASSLDDNYLTLPRMFTFYPFFLLGMDLDRNRIDLLRARIRRMWAFGIFLAINAFLAWVAVSDRISIKIFYGRYDYEYLGLSVPMGIALRAACYLISYIMIYVVAIMIPGAKNSLSALGQKTMAIYLFHGLIFAVFRRGEIWYQSLGEIVEDAILVEASIGTIWLLCQRPFVEFTDWVTHIPMPLLQKIANFGFIGRLEKLRGVGQQKL